MPWILAGNQPHSTLPRSRWVEVLLRVKSAQSRPSSRVPSSWDVHRDHPLLFSTAEKHFDSHFFPFCPKHLGCPVRTPWSPRKPGRPVADGFPTPAGAEGGTREQGGRVGGWSGRCGAVAKASESPSRRVPPTHEQPEFKRLRALATQIIPRGKQTESLPTSAARSTSAQLAERSQPGAGTGVWKGPVGGCIRFVGSGHFLPAHT